MLWVPQTGRRLLQHNTGAVGTATPGTSVTTGAASGTKGTAVELIAATTFDAYWMTIIASNYRLAATASQGCLDILTGAATEEVLIPNLLMGYCGDAAGATTLGPKRWDFPLYVPAGTRLAAQACGARVSTAFRVWIFLYGGDGMPAFRVGSKVTTYGVSAPPNGTTCTPGASGAEGAWTQMTAATTEDHFAFTPSYQASADTTTNDRALAIDLGVGAATEEEIMESWWFHTNSNESMAGPINSMPCFQNVPSGTRLVMRASNSGANDGSYNAAIHAVS